MYKRTHCAAAQAKIVTFQREKRARERNPQPYVYCCVDCSKHDVHVHMHTLRTYLY